MAAGVLGSVLFAGAVSGADGRMQPQRRPTGVRTAQAERARVVEFKSERTDSWLCENVSPFFCSYVPSVASTQSASSGSRQRGRN